MGEHDLNQTTTTQLDGSVKDFSVKYESIDESNNKETFWENPDWAKYLGYYKSIPELKQAILSLAMWAAGKGYEADNPTKVRLSNIRGWGEDSFQSIMENMLIVKKVNGDSYAEIIRNEKGTLINIKPLNPSRMKTVVNQKGIIIRYEEIDLATNKQIRKYQPQDILHLVNDRIANEIHGTSSIEACKWIIDARNEAMEDWRRILHRSTIRVMEVDTEDATTINTIRTQYKEAIKKGEVMIIPKQDKGGFSDLQAPTIQNHIEWIRYLENIFYQAIGTPKIILGGSAEFTEASSKVGYLTFEQVYAREQKDLEADLWNQLAIKVTFNRPVSLKDTVQSDEAKNTGQTDVQHNEANVGLQRSE